MSRKLIEDAVRATALTLGIPKKLSRPFTREVADIIRTSAVDRLLPESGETTAIAITTPKTAALAFDKVLRLPIMTEEDVPREVGYYCATRGEIMIQAGVLIKRSVSSSESRSLAKIFSDEDLTVEQKAFNERSWLRGISQNQGQLYAVSPTIFYRNKSEKMADFKPGPRQVLTAALSNLDIVDEGQLDWKQVLEFRKDQEARVKYRRLLRWLDLELRKSSPQEVIDSLGSRLDDYEWSLRKHGIKAISGSVLSLFDPKFLPVTGISGTVLGLGGLWGALAAAGIVVGKISAEFAQLSIQGEEERRSTNYEIAYVHELKKKLGSN